jgi:hypothetical protein
MGLVLEGDKREIDDINEREPALRQLTPVGGKTPGIFGRIKNWFQDGLF